jgi:transmembrane sensor
MRPAHRQILWGKYAANTCTPEEENELMLWLSDPANEQEAKELLSTLYDQVSAREVPTAPLQPAVLLRAIRAGRGAVARRIFFLRRWGWAAAVAVVLVCLGGYFLLRMPAGDPVGMASLDSAHIMPAAGVTMLTLADGTQIPLDSLHNGTVAQQNGASLVLNNGQLRYEEGANGQHAGNFNTIATPKGQQFQVALPDGSKVWLNAGSSIRFPTSFVGNERRVEVSGEAYFEISQDAQRPFIAMLRKGDEVVVLGTKFNINAYGNESHMYTTLLEGLVRVQAGNEQKVLRPGQQSQSGSGGLKVVNVDVGKALAWKNGAFDFEDVTLAEAMRQIERWYDITVVIESGVPVDAPFYGQVSRKMSLNNLIRLFEKTDLKFRIENGNKLIISK